MTTAEKTGKVLSHSRKVRKSQPSKPKITSTSTIRSTIGFFTSESKRISAKLGKSQRSLLACLGEELFHILLVSLEGDQETGVVNSCDAADPVFIFDNFPFSIWDFDAQVVGRKHIK